jgi:S1-C subfamily serine protease
VPAPTTTISLIPVERTPSTPVLPSAFLSRRASPVAEIFRAPKGTAIEDRFLTDDRLLGEAVALTSDGWFVTTAVTLQNVHLADIVLWQNGQSYTVDHGFLDSLNGTAYLKISAGGLTPTAFAHVADLTGAEAVWTEVRPGELDPHVVLDVRFRQAPYDSVSSEVAVRRLVLSGVSESGDLGSPVWDPDGSLVGLVESTPGTAVRLIPASTIAASFDSLLANGQITHASLGVRAIDVADVRVAGSRGDVPVSGAWLHDDKKSGKPAIVATGAAAKAKLKSGDVILRIERDILDGTADLGEVLADYRPGANVMLRVHRATGDVDIPVDLGSVVTSVVLK